MQYFYIKKGSVNPILRVELINDGRFDFLKNAEFNNAIQNAVVTFSMYEEDGTVKVSRGECSIVLAQADDICTERYIIEYKWNKRDTKKEGIYTGKFEINFNDDLYEYGVEYPSGNLLMPIHEELKIAVLP